MAAYVTTRTDCNSNGYTSITIAEAVLRIHAAGVQHNDLRLANILISADKSEVRIVDFDDASEHTCARAMPVILYAWKPTIADFGCREIHDFVKDLGIWTLGAHYVLT